MATHSAASALTSVVIACSLCTTTYVNLAPSRCDRRTSAGAEVVIEGAAAVPDVLNYLGQALTILALWLERLSSPVPWPLVIAFLFLPFVAIFRTTLWFMRGTTWPVSCKYYHTQQRRLDKPCRTAVAGEWHYCRAHNKPKRMSDGHFCDPSLQRWQERTANGVVDRSDIRGVGFVRLISNAETLLFYKGLARRPGDIWRGRHDMPRRWRQGWERIRDLRPADLFASKQGESPLGVATRMPRVVKATRLTLATYATGLLAVGVSALLSGGPQTVAQYVATMAFILAWEAFRFGVWNDEGSKPRWLRAALIDSSKAFGVLVILALIGNVLASVHASLQTH
jgi:hypothetical protein